MAKDSTPKPKHLRLVHEPLILEDEEKNASNMSVFDQDTLVDHEPLQLDVLELLPKQVFDRGVIIQDVVAENRRRYYLILGGFAEQRFLKSDGSFSNVMRLKQGDVIGVTAFAEVKSITKVTVRVIDLDDIEQSNEPVLIRRAYNIILDASRLSGSIARQDALRQMEMIDELEEAIDITVEQKQELSAKLKKANQRAQAIDKLAKGDLRARVNEVLEQKIRPLEEERDALAASLQRHAEEFNTFTHEYLELMKELERLRKDQRVDTDSVVHTLQNLQGLVDAQGSEIDQLKIDARGLHMHFVELIYPIIPLLLAMEISDPAIHRWAVDILSELHALKIPIGRIL